MILLCDLSWHDAKAKIGISGCGLNRALGPRQLPSGQKNMGNFKDQHQESQLWVERPIWKCLE